MNNDIQLAQYINDRRSAQVPDAVIRDQLVQSGWSPELVDQYLAPSPAPAPRKKKKFVIVGVIVILLIIVIGGVAAFALTRKPKPQPFAALRKTSFSDITFSKPVDWQSAGDTESDTQINNAPSTNDSRGVASIGVVAGYEAIGEGFPSYTPDLQKSLLKKIRQSSDPNNFIEFTPLENCKNTKLSAFTDVTYPDTFLALKSTGTCQLDGQNKTIVIMTVVPKKNGITAALVVGADTDDFNNNQAKFDEIINSIRAK